MDGSYVPVGYGGCIFDAPKGINNSKIEDLGRKIDRSCIANPSFMWKRAIYV